jgi:2-octaprenyl-6-methoxyphenol hydroxylase
MSGASECDVCIVGGGLVGAALALALEPLPLRVVLIEASRPGPGSASFDARALALSNGSRRLFEALGVWRELAPTPIRTIHVSQRGRFGQTRIVAAEQGAEALGYVLEMHELGEVLWRSLGPATRVISPARVTGVRATEDARSLSLDDGTTLAARLVVAADGADSLARREAGVSAKRADYDQSAIVATVLTERAHQGVAYERFSEEGPLALLPCSGGRSVAVLTVRPAEVEAVLALADVAFLARLEARFGGRLGRFLRVGERKAYALALTESARVAAPRTAIIGNAAQGLHPVAGQGFNLGLRDAATLAEVLADAPGDPGEGAVLERYAAWRARDRRALIRFTDGLIRLFAHPSPPLAVARGLGLAAFDLLPPAKRALSRLSFGFAGELPRLARGLPLKAPPA